jgi:hypothetical protein
METHRHHHYGFPLGGSDRYRPEQKYERRDSTEGEKVHKIIKINT